MGLKAWYAKFDEIPEGIRDHYTKLDDGSATLEVEAAGGLSLESGSDDRSNKLSIERQHRKRAEKERDELRRQSEELEAKVDELQDRVSKNAGPSKEELDKLLGERVDRRTKELSAKAEQDLAAMRSQLERRTAQLSELMIDAEAIREIAAAEGEPELLLPHVRRVTRVKLDGDRPLLEVFDPRDPDVVRTADRNGSPMGLAHLVTEMKKDPKLGRAFKGSGTTGSGAGGASAATGAGGGAPRHRNDFKDTADKAHWIRENGVEAFASLPGPPQQRSA